MATFETVKPGLQGRIERVIDGSLMTRHVGGRGLFATPYMILLMEQTAHSSVEPQLPDGYTTVGYEVCVRHLAPADEGETVTVTSEAKLVQSTESSLSTLVNEQTIVTLPLNGRNPLHLIGLVPGVVGHSAEATASGGTSTHYVNGDRGRGITSTQDGIDISDPVIPRGELTNAPVNPDAVEEFRIITSNPKAEYGRTAGAQVEMVTKSGTNQLKGAIYEFMRNTRFDTNSYFNKLQGLSKEELRRRLAATVPRQGSGSRLSQ